MVRKLGRVVPPATARPDCLSARNGISIAMGPSCGGSIAPPFYFTRGNTIDMNSPATFGSSKRVQIVDSVSFTNLLNSVSFSK